MKTLNIEEQIELLKKYNLISDEEIYEFATRAGEIEVNRVSGRQIELLSKFAEGNFEKTDVQEFVKLQFQDNPLKFHYVPKLVFKNYEDYAGLYAQNTISIADIPILTVLQDPTKLPILLDTIGHEWRHCLQAHIYLKDIEQKDQLDYYRNLKASYLYDTDPDPFVINALFDMEQTKIQKRISAFLKNHFAESDLASWYASLSEDEKYSICSTIVASNYNHRACEEDARVGGMLYANLMLSRYKDDQRVQKNAKLAQYIDKCRENLKLVEDEYNTCFNEYKYIEDFTKAISRVTYPMLEEMARYITKSNKRYYHIGQINNSEHAVTALFGVCSVAFLNLIEYDKLEELYQQLKKDILNQDKYQLCSTKRFLATRLLPSIVFCLFTRDNCSAEKAETKIKARFAELYEILWNDRKYHKFDKNDAFLLIGFAYGKLPVEKINELGNYLVQSGRVAEFCDMIDYKTFYNFDAGIACDMNKDYENKIDNLIKTKYQILNDCKDIYLSLDLNEENNYFCTIDYLVQIESLLDICLPEMIVHKADVSPQKYLIPNGELFDYNWKALEKYLGIELAPLRKVDSILTAKTGAIYAEKLQKAEEILQKE